MIFINIYVLKFTFTDLSMTDRPAGAPAGLRPRLATAACCLVFGIITNMMLMN